MKLDRKKTILISVITALVLGSIAVIVYSSSGNSSAEVKKSSTGAPTEAGEDGLYFISHSDGTNDDDDEETIKTMESKLMVAKPDASVVKKLFSWKSRFIYNFTYSMKTMKAGCTEGTTAFSLDLKSFELKEIAKDIEYAYFNPDCNAVLLVDHEHSVKYFKYLNLETGYERKLDVNESARPVKIIEGNKLIYTEVIDQRVKVFKMDLESESPAEEIFSYRGVMRFHSLSLDTDLECSNDGKIIGYKEPGDKICFYDTEKKAYIQAYAMHSNFTLSPDGRYFINNRLTAGKHQTFITEVVTGSEVKIVDENAKTFLISWSPDSKYFLFEFMLVNDKNSSWLSILSVETMKQNTIKA